MKKIIEKMIALSLVVSLSISSMVSVFAADSRTPDPFVKGSGNLLYNGGFEVDGELSEPSTTDTSSPLLEGWLSKSVEGVQFSLCDDAYEGSRSLKVNFSYADGGSFILLPSGCDDKGIVSGLLPGVYALSFYAKGTVGTVGVRFKDAGVDQVTEKSFLLTSDWSQLTVDNLLVDETGSINLEVFGESSLSGMMFMDGFLFSRCPGIDNGDFELDKYVKREPMSKPGVPEGGDRDYIYTTVNNVLTNAGFEASTEVRNTNKKSYADAVITAGWTTAWSLTSNVWSLSADSHSGTNALKVDMNAAGNDGKVTDLFADHNLITGAKPLGRTRLEADTTYFISYWAKGDARTRLWARVFQVNAGVSTETITSNKSTKTTDLTDEWTLYTTEVTTNSLGEVYWKIEFSKDTDDQRHAAVDDVAVQKKDDAIRSVEAMIEKLDVTADNAQRAIDDITQWCAALGSENIKKYNDFLRKITPNQYLTNGNVLTNAGFEASTEVTQPKKDAGYQNAVMTEGWTTPYAHPNNKWSLSNDPHRGNNSLKVELEISGGNNNTSLAANYNLIANEKPLGRTRLEPDTTYVISYWAKGNAKIRFWSRVFKVSNGTSTEVAEREYSTKYEDLSETWKLYTEEVTTNSLGEIRWQIDFRQEDANAKYAIVDDVAVQKMDDAISSVEAMIEALNVKGNNAQRAIADIEQWCAALGSENITNYDMFTSKKADYNPGGSGEDIPPAESKIPYWVASDESVISIQEDAVSGERALKAAFAGAGSVTVATIDAPFGFGPGYYTLSFQTKGTGSVQVEARAYSASGEEVILDKETDVSTVWKETIFQGIDIPEGYKLKSLAFTLSTEAAGDIFLDAIQMYEQLGPGAALDDVVVENRGSVLFLDGAPEGYEVSLHSSSDSAVLALDGAITIPKNDVSVDYRYVIVNKNDENDKAISQKHTLYVKGTEGEASEFSQRTITDADTGIAVTGLMKEDAAIQVRVLGNSHEYYSQALKEGYDSIGLYNVYLIPKSAYRGAVIVDFKIDSSYNGKEITIVQINRDTKERVELTGVVSNGILSLNVADDGAFMLQIKKSAAVPGHSGNGDSNTQDNPGNGGNSTPGTTSNGNSNTSDIPGNGDHSTPNNSGNHTPDMPKNPGDDNGDVGKNGGEAEESNTEMIILIIVIGAAVILIALAVTATVLIVGKKKDYEAEQDDAAHDDSEGNSN